MRKCLFCLLTGLLINTVKVLASDYNLETEIVKKYNGAQKTSEALMAIPEFEEKANYFAWRLRNLTLGDYAEDILVVAPLITGKVQFKMLKLDVELDYRAQKSQVMYNYKF